MSRADPAGPAVAVNVALEVPDCTLTVAGTDAEELLLDNVTVRPPGGATAVKKTVHVAFAPGATLGGVQEMLDRLTT